MYYIIIIHSLGKNNNILISNDFFLFHIRKVSQKHICIYIYIYMYFEITK